MKRRERKNAGSETQAMGATTIEAREKPGGGRSSVLQLAGLSGAVATVLAAVPGTSDAAIYYSGPGRNVCNGPIDLEGDGLTDLYNLSSNSWIVCFPPASAWLVDSTNLNVQRFASGSPCAVGGPWVAYGFLEPGPFASPYNFVKTRFSCASGTCYGWLKYSAGTRCVDSWGSETSGGAILTGQTAPTAVELVAFDGIAGLGRVNLTWETASEIDCAGFNVWRASEVDGEYEQINADVIPSQGGPARGASYSFEDTGCDTLKCYYKLEDLDTNGTSVFHGPIEVAKLARFCGTMDGDSGFNIFALFLPPAAAIALWLRRQRRREKV